MTQEIEFADMFGGIGGFRLGLQQASERFKCRYYWEKDENAVTSYNHIFDESHDPTDVTQIEPEQLGNIDLLCAGFPCQSFSIAGHRGGFEDTRGTLFFEIARIAKEKLPQILLLENVKGLLSHSNGETFRTVLSTLHELGYGIEWQVLNSKHHGVPQNRERVFIIGHLGGLPRQQIFPIYGQTEGTAEKDAGETTEQGLTTKRDGGIKTRNTSTCIDSNYFKGLDNHGQRTAIIQQNQREEINIKGISGAVHGQMSNNQSPKIINHQMRPESRPSLSEEGQSGGSGILFNDEYSYALSSSPHYVLTQQMAEIRRLTPRECWRLQGFPDWAFEAARGPTHPETKPLNRGENDFIISENTRNERNSDTQLYKQAGNAATVNVITDIGNRIKQLDAFNE